MSSHNAGVSFDESASRRGDEGGGDLEDPKIDDQESQRKSLLMQAVGSQYSILEAERGATIYESSGRSSLYLTSLSGAVIGLSFVAQASKFGDAFFLFTLAILPVVFFLGVVTYYRNLQTGVEDVLCAQAMARIRGFYKQIDSRHAELFREVTLERVGIRPGGLFSRLWWQQFLSAAAMIAIVNSVVGGVFIALVMSYSFNRGPLLGIALGIGAAVVFGLAFLRHQWTTMMAINRALSA
jgi:hypothetical protein